MEMVRSPCNFCEFSRSGYGCDSQDNDAELRREVEKLRFLIKRIRGKDDTATFTEMLSIENHLKDVRIILQDQKRKVELEEDENGSTRLSESNSSQFGHKKYAPLLKYKRNFESRNAESLQAKFERLWLLNERMNGRELDGMTSLDLTLLNTEISLAMMALINQKSYPMREQMARQCKDVENKEPNTSRLTERERCSLDICDFCGFCSNNKYDQSPHAQEQAPQEVLSMESQFKRLKLLTRRMTCQDLDGLSFSELILLETHLKDVLPLVQDQKKKIEGEEKQVQRTPKNEKNGLGTRGHGSSSSGERQEQQNGEAPLPVLSKAQIEYERQSAESMEIKIEKLWLLKERMNGRELEGMNSAELKILEERINQALSDLGEHRCAPTIDQVAKKHREVNHVSAFEPQRDVHWGNDKDDHLLV